MLCTYTVVRAFDVEKLLIGAKTIISSFQIKIDKYMYVIIDNYALFYRQLIRV